MYQGPARPRGEVALIAKAPGGKARVYAIDGNWAGGDGWTVLPGPHEVWVNFQVIRYAGDTTYTIWTYCRIDFEASAGTGYVVESFATQEHLKGADVKTVMGARIRDAEGKSLTYPQSCSGNRPKLH
ncbi:MAG TPA: hypothetical protein VKH41_02225 [Myxococcota bacterium]|nr:hypothetical protein [Myxococcota bacterium]